MPRKLTQEEFLEKAQVIHGDKYDYTDTIYIGYGKKLKIKCRKCGNIFFQQTNHHLRGIGCPHCAGNIRSTKEAFIEKARKIHGDKYNYDKVEYVNQYTDVIIICPIHREFIQRPNSHLNKKGCPKCADRRLTTEEFIRRAKEVHGEKYDYSVTEYINKRTKVKIRCKKCGNIFEAFPNNHVGGNQGCICQKPKSGKENEIAKLLKEHNVNHERQKHFNGCKHKGSLAFDFYLPNHNLCIEFQGQQHYDVVKGWGGEEGLKDRQIKDQIKRDFCKTNNIGLLEIRYDEDIFIKLDEILNLSEMKVVTEK